MGTLKEYIQVSEVMTRRPVVISTGSSVQDAAKLMRRHSISSLLVTSEKSVEGIFTTDDIIWKLVADNKSPSEILVDDVMTKSIIFIAPTDDVADAMELMNENDIKQLPVIADNELVGYLTLKDILRIEPAMIDLTIEQVRLQEDRRQKKVQELFDKEGLDIDEDLFE